MDIYVIRYTEKDSEDIYRTESLSQKEQDDKVKSLTEKGCIILETYVI
jgi:hypothetical protein